MSETKTQPKVVYRKDKYGDWKLMGPSSVLVPGQVVTVTKADGSTKQETVGTVAGSFTREDGVVCAYASIRGTAKKYQSSDGRCRECRGPIVNARHHRAMGGLCGDCAFDEYDM